VPEVVKAKAPEVVVQPVIPVKSQDADFEVATGRVKVAKQIRKIKQRKDSLDDHSSESEDEPAPAKRGRQLKVDEETEKKRQEAQAIIDAEVKALKAITADAKLEEELAE
jgi:hypothetical protein